ADAALQPLRDREAVTGAVLQRYTILAEQLAEETRRAGQRQAELEDRIRQLAADGVRERELVEEAETTLAVYGEERDRLADEGHATLTNKRTALAEAQAASAEAEELALSADEASASAEDNLEAARPRLADIDAALNRLEAEAATLGKMLNVGASLWPAIVDEL